MNDVLKPEHRIYIAGHRGMVGGAIHERLRSMGFNNLLVSGRDDLDLTRQDQVEAFFARNRIDHVVLAAAKVGGIHANSVYPAQFIYENIIIASNVVNAAFRNGVDRLLFLGSSCIYPKHAKQPMDESQLLTGPLDPTNEPYALAKIAGIKLCESYNREYGTHYRSVMPTNLYGPGDNFHPENSHVIPALLRRFHEAAQSKATNVEVWGTGNAVREFLHVRDMADACIHVMSLSDEAYEANTQAMLAHINVGTGQGITIRDLAHQIAGVTGYKGEISFDTSRPDGTPVKVMDVSRLENMGWKYRIGFEDGLRSTYEWFVNTGQYDLREK